MNKSFVFFSCIMIMLILSCSNNENRDTIHPVSLECEMLKSPMGIDVKTPRLSWMLTSEQGNEKQTAYQIIVSSSAEKLKQEEADLWDSKKVKTDQSINVKYDGKPMQPKMECYWKVKVWDKEGNPSAWSEPAKWSMGLIDDEWKADWIGLNKPVGNDIVDAQKTILSARYLRKEFDLAKPVKKAYLYICGLGLYESYLNGQKVGDYVLAPAQTEFDERVLYNTFNVTDLLKEGKNAIGTVLGNGRYFAMRMSEPFTMENYGFPKLLLHLDIEYNDGSHKIITSDKTWKLTADGPILENNEYDGEKYDARKEMPGWKSPGFDDSGWMNATIVGKPCEKISAQMTEPIRITQTIKPKTVEESRPDTFIFDMGQNMVGWVSLKVKGEKGARVKLRFAEVLNDEGLLYLDNIRSAEVTDVYTCKGEGVETWQPKFTYHGFRYVEVTGYPGTPDLNAIQGKVVHDDVARTGTFECAANMINQIYKNAVWGIRGNYRSFPTDCPQRDERHAWLGDRATGSRGESYIFDIQNLYNKWLQDIGDSQLESGSISDVSPAYWEMYHDNVTWDGTPIILADMLYDQFGDIETIRRNYSYLKKWMDHMTDNYMEDGIMPRDNYGDWCVPPEEPETIHTTSSERITDGTFLGTAFFYYQTNLMKQFAELLEKKEDADFYDLQAKKIKEAFNNKYFDKHYVVYSNNTATANVLVLALNLVPDEYEDKIFFNLIEKTEVQHEGHIPTGLIGVQFLMRTLTKYGRPDMAYRFATQTDYPSWGYMVESGATTIWELWNGNTADPAMNSRNHVMLLGDFNIWLYEDLAGIKPASPGFKKIVMKPTMIRDMDYVKASHQCPYGKINSHWEVNNNDFSWDITVPVNTEASVFVPAKVLEDVKINGKKAGSCKLVDFIEAKNGYAEFKVGSGSYTFSSNSYDAAYISNEEKNVNTPIVKPEDTTATEAVRVTMDCKTEDAMIYYTIDYSVPTSESKRYDAPFMVDDFSYLRVKAFKEGMKPSFEQISNIDIYDPAINGLNYKYYEGKWEKLPDYASLTPKATGKVKMIEDIGKLKQREDYWGLVYTGYIGINESGEYSFILNSDDGSRLFINDKMVLENDGVHSPKEVEGSVKLEKGKAAIRIEYFEGNYGEKLAFFFKGPNFPRMKVPVSILYYE